jgi:hypothetical protein
VVHSSSLSNASAKYGISNSVEALRELAIQLRKAKTTAEEAKRGSGLLARLSVMGITLEKLSRVQQYALQMEEILSEICF